MMRTMCTTKRGEGKEVQLMPSTDPAKMSTGTCTGTTWRNWFNRTGEQAFAAVNLILKAKLITKLFI